MSTAGDTARRDRPGKSAILRAAVTVMGEDGYEGASTRDMAARAGVSVAALYYHFPSKHDLLREFLHDAYDGLLARLDKRVAEAGDDPAARLDAVVAGLIGWFLHDDFAQMACNVAMREHVRLDPPDRAEIEAKRGRMLQIVEQVVTDGIARGVFADHDAREVARVVVTLCSSLVEPFPEMNRSLEQVVELYQGFARAVATAP